MIDDMDAAKRAYIKKRNRRGRKKTSRAYKVFISLFFIPFFIAGIGIAGWSLYDYAEHYKVMQWDKAQGYITHANFRQGSDGEGGTTYRAEAKYTYTYKGRNYSGDRASLYSNENDNIGSFQRDVYQHLNSYRRSGDSIPVYVNPDMPEESIIWREFRWGFFAFKFILGSIFLGFAGAIFYVMWFGKDKPRTASGNPEYKDRPWLENSKWQGGDIKSDAKSELWFAAGFALLWNVISWVIMFPVYEELAYQGNAVVLIGLIFPLVGLWFIVWAVKAFLEYNRFGDTPMTLDPFPGSIGGHVGGTIYLKQRFGYDTPFKISLSNIYSYESGSGKNRRRSERVEWQNTVYPHAEPYLEGTRLSFRFDVPDDGTHETEYNLGHRDYHLWRIHLVADVEGIDLDRNFEIPVYKTNEISRNISDRTVEEMSQRTDQGYDKILSTALPLRQGVMGHELYYPALRNIKAGLSGLIFAGIFLASAYFLLQEESAPDFMGWIFGVIGGVILLASVHAMFNSLKVTSDSVHIITKRTLFWVLPIVKKMRISDIKDVRAKRTSTNQAGNKRTHTYYKIVAYDQGRNRLTLAEGIEGMGTANKAVEEIKRAFNIT